MPIGRSNSTLAAPVITTSPRPASVRLRSIVEFTCVARGSPYPDLTWWNDGRLINTDGRITVSNGGQHLRVVDVQFSDGGLYVCRASNFLGRDEAVAKLSVRGGRELGAPTSDASAAISFLYEPPDMAAAPGTTIQLPCIARGNNAMDIGEART